MTIETIFLSLFITTFFVALIAFGAYGYLLLLLTRNHAEKFNPTGAVEFLYFLWTLLFYYVQRAFTGFFGISSKKEFKRISKHARSVRQAEAEQKQLLKIYRLFSSAYILFFVLFILLMVTLLYMVVGPSM